MKTADYISDTESSNPFHRQPARANARATAGGIARLLAVCAALALAACAEVPQVKERKVPEAPLVFPAPPDEPRFYYERTLYGSPDVAAEDKNSKLRQLLTGQGERGGEGLGKPFSVTTYHGKVFVSDTVNRDVRVFDFPNRRFYKIGDAGPGQLIKPAGLDVDRNGNLYVADATAKAVKVYDAEGNFLRQIGSEKWFDRLSSVTLDPRGDRMYVVDIGGVSSNHHRVRVFDPVTGRHLFDFGRRGSGPGEFNLPYDLAVGKDGRLYVVDAGNFRVQIFDHDGKYLKSFGQLGKQLGDFARPKEIATDAQGNVYVVDAAHGNFQIFDPDGQLLLFIGQHSEQDRPAGYMLPSGIHVDEDGRVYFVDQWFRKIDVFRPARLQPGEGWLAGKNPQAPPTK